MAPNVEQNEVTRGDEHGWEDNIYFGVAHVYLQSHGGSRGGVIRLEEEVAPRLIHCHCCPARAQAAELPEDLRPSAA